MTSLSTPAAASAAAPDDAELARRVSGIDLESKVRLLTGATLWAMPAEPRLGLHPVVMSDGPQGVRGTGDVPGATGLLAPAPSALGATWDIHLAERLGALFATEARRRAADVVLAPAINLQRTPVAGRHFEYFAEDPLLTGRLAAGLVRGLQDGGVAACPKHFVANDSETERTRYVSRVDARTLREVYLAPFRTVLEEAGAWSVMAAYSGVDDGTATAPMSEHAGLLRGVLKGEWHFTGPVVSDWAAARTTAASAVGGLDLVMPGPDGPWGAALVAAVRSGDVPESVVDDKVLRLLRLARHVGRLTEPWADCARPPAPAGPTEAEFTLLRQVAARSTVLLRDRDHLLPLAPGGLRRVALIGPNAVAPYFQGGGSAFVPAVRTIGFEEGLRAALPAGTELTVHRGGDARRHPPFIDPALLGDGVRADYLDAAGTRLGGDLRPTGDWGDHHDFPAGTHRVVLSTELTLAEPGTHRLEIGAVGRYEIRVDGDVTASGDDDRGVGLVLDSSHHHPAGNRVELAVGDTPRRVGLVIDLTVVDAEGYGRLVTAHLRHRPPGPGPEEEIEEAVAAALRADAAVVVVGTNEEVESEGWDRTGLALPGHQEELVRRVAAANPRTVVAVNAGAPVLLPWSEAEVPALLWLWLPGQEAGHALADVLFGRAEPAGRLPCTLPARAEDVPVPHARPENGVVTYTEGLDIGYRGWERTGATPAFPFGHGLGWTTWHYESFTGPAVPGTGDEGLRLTVRVTNTGPRPGREVVQVYLRAPQEGPPRPRLALAGFAGAQVPAGGTAEVTVTVPARAFQVWNPATDAWHTPPGTYHLHAGRSSRDLRLITEVTV
ncbi:beta-glucosidase family protein [Streptomyces johnsoniae]|uniref:Glycoside hydrolase family 3 C-terminal domain-containing protein n=1 Tax=Streptomyces johnsoniae TaxID=3075532 RepID=A0ABU2RXP3_9ACTN|nr:glycoside hydrolase family 3 C-terminal domain-containing protein [Streptomyces sp. DSM 41886]MDT0441508.1 glycoside hydrolase family 3 C-terminal domain-containing protein [Streptomyces sp. DSM 41886]